MENSILMIEEQERYDALLARWHTHCADTGIKHYFTDGPVTEKYWREPTRILVMNLEAYGYEECGHTPVNEKILRHWMTSTGGNIRTKTTRFTSVFINSLFKRLSGKIPISAETIRESYHEIDTLLAAMNRISYVNIRKISNANVAQDVPMIRHELENNRWYLKEQLEILAPHLVIFGGKEGCNAANALYNLEGQLPYQGMVKAHEDCLLVSVRHFSRISYTNFEDTIERIAQTRSNPNG